MPQITILRPKPTDGGGKMAQPTGAEIILSGDNIQINDGSDPVVIVTGSGRVDIFTEQDAIDRIKGA